MNIRELKQEYNDKGYEVIETSCKGIYVLRKHGRSEFEERTHNLESLEEHLFELEV